MQKSRPSSADQILLDGVRATLRTWGLSQTNERVLVACSGGPDSQCLLHVLHALRDEHGLVLGAASVNHGLRADADADVAVASELANSLGVPFWPLRVHVAPGASVQAQARVARYAALTECAERWGARWVAVGHTRDDQAETVLARLIRGTGVDGLAAIAPLREDGVVRPLLSTSRGEVRDYIARHNLTFVNDPANENTRFLRSRIRAELLPWLQAENPQVCEALAELAEDARALRRWVEGEAERALVATGMSAEAVARLPQPLRREVLRLWAAGVGTRLTRTHILALERMLVAGGEVRLPGDFCAHVNDVGSLHLAPISKRGRGRARLE